MLNINAYDEQIYVNYISVVCFLVVELLLATAHCWRKARTLKIERLTRLIPRISRWINSWPRGGGEGEGRIEKLFDGRVVKCRAVKCNRVACNDVTIAGFKRLAVLFHFRLVCRWINSHCRVSQRDTRDIIVRIDGPAIMKFSPRGGSIRALNRSLDETIRQNFPPRR